MAKQPSNPYDSPLAEEVASLRDYIEKFDKYRIVIRGLVVLLVLMCVCCVWISINSALYLPSSSGQVTASDATVWQADTFAGPKKDEPDKMNVPFAQPNKTFLEDILRLVLPLLVLAIGFMLGFLGLKRLDQYDERIHQERKFIYNRIEHLEARSSDGISKIESTVASETRLIESKFEEARKELLRERTQLKDDFQSFSASQTGQVNARFTVLEKEVKERAREIASSTVAGEIEGVRASVIEFEEVNRRLIDKIAVELKPYAWLEKKHKEAEQLANVRSIAIAHNQITEFFVEGETDKAVRIAEYAIDKKLTGSPDEFHNMAVELARNDYHPLALGTVQLGLEKFPSFIDLIADGVKYAYQVGEIDLADELFRQLSEIDKSRWNWRAFVFAGDYLEGMNRIDDALAFYREFAAKLPYDERAYSQPGVFFLQLGRIDEAREILEEGMDKCARVAQVGRSLSKVYFEMGEYEKAIQAADRALESTAEDQPSVNMSAVLWGRATAMDSLIHKTVREREAAGTGEVIDEELAGMVRSCLIDYKASMSTADSLPHFRYRGKQRMDIIKALLAKYGIGIGDNGDGPDEDE